MPKNAVQWKGDNYDELLAFVGADISFDKQNNPPVLLIGTRGGVISAESGDWVVKADNGDFSVSKEGK